MMHCTRVCLLLSLLVLLLVWLGGCKTQTAAPVTAPVVVVPAVNTPVAKTQYVELTYPQSDDQGHYVGIAKDGEVMVSGLVAALTQPTGVVVNGVTAQPYLVEGLAPFGTPAGYNTYAFSAPVPSTRDTLISVALQALGVTSPATTFAADGTSTYARLVELAGLAPKEPTAQYRLANALLARQDYDAALAAYQRSVALEPQFAWGYDGLGQTYVLLQRPADAVIHFKKAKKLHPKWADTRYRLAEVYTSQKQYDVAAAEYRDALKLAPNHPGLHRGFAVALYNHGLYREAWDQVYEARKYGATPPPAFEKKLRERMPDPRHNALKPDRDDKQKEPDSKRQDGVRNDGPHAVSQTGKPNQRNDEQRRPGADAKNKPNNRGKGN